MTFQWTASVKDILVAIYLNIKTLGLGQLRIGIGNVYYLICQKPRLLGSYNDHNKINNNID